MKIIIHSILTNIFQKDEEIFIKNKGNNINKYYNNQFLTFLIYFQFVT
jgi:hypothetical protein